MHIKLPPKFFKCTFIAVLSFAIGLLLALIFQPTTTVKVLGDDITSNIQSHESIPTVAKIRTPSYTIITIIFGVTLLLLIYGYYKEKQKK